MKKGIVFVSAFLLMALAANVILYQYRYLLCGCDMERALKVDFSSVDKVTLQSGLSMNRTNITGKENLQAFFQLFRDVRLDKKERIGRYTGYAYWVQLYRCGTRVTYFTFGYQEVIVPAGGHNSIRYMPTNIESKKMEEISQTYGLDY